jgi:hypothetical protein
MLAVFPTKQFPVLLSQTKETSSVSIKDLRNAPTVAVISSTSLHLSASPWRDFMPGMWGLDGSPLMIVLKVTTADQKPFPSGMRMDRAWVLFGDRVWEISDLRGRLKDQPNPEEGWINCSASTTCQTTARNGPKWGPGVLVDVVIQLTDREGKQHFLQARGQYINRSD